MLNESRRTSIKRSKPRAMKDSESFSWLFNFKSPTIFPKTVFKLIFYFIILLSFSYVYNSLDPASLISNYPLARSISILVPNPNKKSPIRHRNFETYPIVSSQEKTQVHHIVFGIAASSKLWAKRKDYIKLWWEPEKMRGFVWLDNPVRRSRSDNESLPLVKISSDTSEFKYTNSEGDRSAIRISRIVSETVRLELDDVRWIVMGDDDTIFVADNLVRVLSKYDHNKFYYIGKPSESHVQNIHFSYNMAYGGGGFAISYPLAKALEKMQDSCINRYPNLYGSDDRIQACMAELGVPLTLEKGFHQLDIYGDPFGLLAAHPVAPLVSLHHLDVIEPIFPKTSQIQALRRLKMAMKLDSAGLMQQSICYDNVRRWTISVSWGYAAQIFPDIITAREMEIPLRTFVNWYRLDDEYGFSFNTRPLDTNECQKPFVYVLSNAIYNRSTNRTASEYVRIENSKSKCKWEKTADPSYIRRVEIYKMRDPNLWDKPPRRNCCRVLPSTKKGTIAIDVGECREGEFIAL